MTTVIASEHLRDEWSRMAKDAYANGRNFIGSRMSAAAALYPGNAVRCDVYDALQMLYRQWLNEGIQSFDA